MLNKDVKRLCSWNARIVMHLNVKKLSRIAKVSWTKLVNGLVVLLIQQARILFHLSMIDIYLNFQRLLIQRKEHFFCFFKDITQVVQLKSFDFNISVWFLFSWTALFAGKWIKKTWNSFTDGVAKVLDQILFCSLHFTVWYWSAFCVMFCDSIS